MLKKNKKKQAGFGHRFKIDIKYRKRLCGSWPKGL